MSSDALWVFGTTFLRDKSLGCRTLQASDGVQRRLIVAPEMAVLEMRRQDPVEVHDELARSLLRDDEYFICGSVAQAVNEALTWRRSIKPHAWVRATTCNGRLSLRTLETPKLVDEVQRLWETGAAPVRRVKVPGQSRFKVVAATPIKKGTPIGLFGRGVMCHTAGCCPPSLEKELNSFVMQLPDGTKVSLVDSHLDPRAVCSYVTEGAQENVEMSYLVRQSEPPELYALYTAKHKIPEGRELVIQSTRGADGRWQSVQQKAAEMIHEAEEDDLWIYDNSDLKSFMLAEGRITDTDSAIRGMFALMIGLTMPFYHRDVVQRKIASGEADEALPQLRACFRARDKAGMRAAIERTLIGKT